jgi:hypothetical protein
MQLLGFLRNVHRNPGEGPGGKQLAVLVDWRKVDTHMVKVRKSARIHLDPDCLRWIPLLTQLPNAYQSPEEAGDTSSELASPALEQQPCATKPVAAMPEKIQRVKIRKKFRSRKMGGGGHRRNSPIKSRALPLQRSRLIKQLKRVRKICTPPPNIHHLPARAIH